ncbi:MAG: methyltransferase [Pseudomonadota bacterium]
MNLLNMMFEKGFLEPEMRQASALLSHPHDMVSDVALQNFEVVHYWKPSFDQWKQGARIIHTPSELKKSYELVVCSILKSKELSLFHMAQSIMAAKDNAMFVVIGANDQNGKRLSQWIDEFHIDHQSYSKQKHRIVWGRVSESSKNKALEYIQDFGEQDHDFGVARLRTKPGIFGWKKIDKGSKLLLETLPKLSGKGADFGCGYGYLSHQILKSKPEQSLDLYEADYYALECAKQNVSFAKTTQFFWQDLTRDTPVKQYDFIVMNPPFHEGKKSNSDIGKEFIKMAASCLHKRESLYMVANIFLAYERILEEHFYKVEKVDERDGFKVFHAQK